MQLQPRKWGLYRYCLDHPYARFGFTPKDKIPAIRVQPRAEFLHGAGVDYVVEWARSFLESVCGPVLLEVSRLDLFADFQGLSVSGDQRREFLCRADARHLFETAEEFNGLQIGSRSSGTIFARIYDKTIESAKIRHRVLEGRLGRPVRPGHSTSRASSSSCTAKSCASSASLHPTKCLARRVPCGTTSRRTGSLIASRPTTTPGPVGRCRTNGVVSSVRELAMALWGLSVLMGQSSRASWRISCPRSLDNWRTSAH